MNILGIETTTKFLCVGVFKKKTGAVSSLTLDVGTRHAELLASIVQQVMAASSLTFPELGCVAVGVGPGSFTGIRVGVSAAKGFAWAAGVPVLAVPSLDVVARNALYSEYGRAIALQGGMIIPLVDAKRGLVYYSGYRVRKGIITRVMPYTLAEPREVRTHLRGAVALCGDGAGLYKDVLTSGMKNAIVLDKDFWYPAAGELMQCAAEHAAAKELVSGDKIKPLYLYPKDCQVRPCVKTKK